MKEIKIVFPEREKALIRENRELRSLVWLLVSITVVSILVTSFVLYEYTKIKNFQIYSGKILSI